MDFNPILGIVARSGPCTPSPLSCTSALRWRRLPLTSTSILSALIPRSVGGRTKVAPSLIAKRCTWNEGTSVLMMSSMSSDDTLSISCRLKTSTGTADSTAVRPLRRVPVITISSSVLTTSCCAIALQGDSAAITKLLVVRANQAFGRFLLIVTDPRPSRSNLLIIAGIFARKALPKALYKRWGRTSVSH